MDEFINERSAYCVNHMHGNYSKEKGQHFIFKMPSQNINNANAHMLDQVRVANMMAVNLRFFDQDNIKYPYATRRITGRMWPGEDRRQVRKTKIRKMIRSQSEVFCKTMLFKKGKFIPGRMV